MAREDASKWSSRSSLVEAVRRSPSNHRVFSRLAGPLSVDWFNHPRLHGEIPDDAGYTTPAAFEADHYSQNPAALEAVTQ